MSAATVSATVTGKCSSAAASFSPPRLAYRGLVVKVITASGPTWLPGLSTSSCHQPAPHPHRSTAVPTRDSVPAPVPPLTGPAAAYSRVKHTRTRPFRQSQEILPEPFQLTPSASSTSRTASRSRGSGAANLMG